MFQFTACSNFQHVAIYGMFQYTTAKSTTYLRYLKSISEHLRNILRSVVNLAVVLQYHAFYCHPCSVPHIILSHMFSIMYNTIAHVPYHALYYHTCSVSRIILSHMFNIMHYTITHVQYHT